MFPEICHCVQAGFCHTLNREMTSGMYAECRSNIEFRRNLAGTTTITPYVQDETNWPQLRPPCIHLGMVSQTCGCGDRARDIRHCESDQQTEYDLCWRSPYVSTLAHVRSCNNCPHHDAGPPPSCGVVIGSYNMPNMIALQVKLIRDHCGDVPILIVDDCSSGYGHTAGPDTVNGKLRAIAAANKDVMLFVHPVRFGHGSGDLSKFWMGIQWAAAKGIKVLAALSQRLLVDRHRWLQDGARALVQSGLSISGQPSVDEPFPVRTESVLIDVEKWNQPAILDHLMPRTIAVVPGTWGIATENVIWDDVVHRLGGGMHPWETLNTKRYVRHPGIIWHCSHGRDDYAAMARRYGLELDATFSTNGWPSIEGANYRG